MIIRQDHRPNKMIWVTFNKEGMHKYPAALTDPNLATGDEYDVSFLGYPHRHIFHFKIWIGVTHDDRDIERLHRRSIGVPPHAGKANLSLRLSTEADITTSLANQFPTIAVNGRARIEKYACARTSDVMFGQGDAAQRCCTPRAGWAKLLRCLRTAPHRLKLQRNHRCNSAY